MADSPTEYSVKFGSVAWTVEYKDSRGDIVFTLDEGSHGAKSICLEHHALQTTRPPHYDIAFQKTKEYLESCGYQVETFAR